MKTLERPTTRTISSRRRAEAACCSPLGSSPADDEPTLLAVRRFKALADATRLTMLRELVESAEPVCACELGEGVELGQPTVSHHLKVLRDAGLVTSERRGTWAYYRLHPAAAEWVRATLAALPR